MVTTPSASPSTGSAEPTGPGRLAIFAALNHRNFRFFWLAQISAVSAQAMEFVAGAWLVLDLTGSPLIAVRVGPRWRRGDRHDPRGRSELASDSTDGMRRPWLRGLLIPGRTQPLGQVGKVLHHGARGGANGAAVLALDLREQLAAQNSNGAGRVDANADLHAVDLENEDLDISADEDALPWAPTDD